jgi:hypothetical protein
LRPNDGHPVAATPTNTRVRTGESEVIVLAKLKSMGYSANLSYALGFISVIASIVVWFTQGGSGSDEMAKAAGERFGIFVGLWAPTFMALGNGIANLPDNK